MNDLNCPVCGTTYQSISPGLCDCCGYEFTDSYIQKFLKEQKKLENEQIRLTKAAEENERREKKEQARIKRQVEEEEIKRKKKEAYDKLKLIKEKRKKDLAKKLHSVNDNIGIALFVVFTAVIIIATIHMVRLSTVSSGWIFFIICAIISTIASYLSYTSFHNQVKKDFAYIMTSGLLGAFVSACTIVDGWVNLVVDAFDDGFLIVLFSGWLILIVFLLICIITIVLSIAITQVLPAYIQSKKTGTVGSIIGLIIASVCAGLYLFFIEKDGIALVLGR